MSCPAHGVEPPRVQFAFEIDPTEDATPLFLPLRGPGRSASCGSKPQPIRRETLLNCPSFEDWVRYRLTCGTSDTCSYDILQIPHGGMCHRQGRVMFGVPAAGFRQRLRTADRDSVQLLDIGRHGLSFRWSTEFGTESITGLGILLTAYEMDVQRPIQTGVTMAKSMR